MTVAPEVVDLRRFDDPGIGLGVTVPDVVFGPDGATQRARDSATVMRTLEAVPDLRITHRRRVSVSGAPGRSMLLSVKRSAARAEFCATACVPLFGRGRLTLFVATPGKARLTLVQARGRPVVLLEDTPDGRSLPQTGTLVRSLRLG